MLSRMNNIFAALPFLITAILAHSARALGGEESSKQCVDLDPNCANWIIEDREGNICTQSTFVAQKCRQSCPQHCPPSSIFANYDESRVPDNLKPISWLLGVWRSEHDGKAMFPTIPKFTYGEEISISLSDAHLNSEPAFNYTAFAWSSHDKDELHSENGFITVYSGTTRVALTTVMNNGFVTVEEGPVSNFRIRFKLVDIGRISFSRDLPVHDLVREWTLIDGHHLESRLDMETLTHGMREHTVITYTKIFP